MKVNVNKDVCIGCGACQQISDDYFVLGDDGYAEVNEKDRGKEVPKEKEDVVIDALESCPVEAIYKEEE